MDSELKKIKKLGSYSYYLSKDNKFFVKECKGERELLEKEYLNLKKIWNKLNIEDFDSIEPIDFNAERERLISRYIDAEPIITTLQPEIYFKFGQKLNEFHKKGYSHGHLEFNDILYKNGKLYLTDLPRLNEEPALLDIVTLDLSIKIFKLKKPWLWKKYKKCLDAFFKGYQFLLSKEYINLFREKLMSRIIDHFNDKEIYSKLEGIILLFLLKTGLIRWI